MFKQAITLGVLLSVSTLSVAQDGMISVESKHSVSVTVDKLVKVLGAKGMTVFNTVEHSKAASDVGISIDESVLVVFGNPKVGSPLMKCAASVAIDLPQKALISEDAQKRVWISYNDPQYLKQRHNIQGCDKVLDKVSGALANFSKAAAN